MMSMIVHDLRSPLSAITSSMRLLQESADPADKFGQSVLRMSDISGRAARKLLNLVNSLLDVVKMESGIISLEREKVNLESLIHGVLAEFTPMAYEMDVRIEVTNLNPQPLIYVDPDKIERVFYNLLDNAIKFSPGDSLVRIEGQPTNKNGFVRVNVIDQGMGIRDEDKVKLFNRFQQVEEQLARRRGTGLGLTFCKLAIEAHGGQIWIEDNPSGGSIFAFTLPIKK
jgi:signal transduction histidine kinase